jgi:hypothetical protein
VTVRGAATAAPGFAAQPRGCDNIDTLSARGAVLRRRSMPSPFDLLYHRFERPGRT